MLSLISRILSYLNPFKANENNTDDESQDCISSSELNISVDKPNDFIFIEKTNIKSIDMTKDELLKYITVKQNTNNKLLNIEYKNIINDWKYIKKNNIQNSVMETNKFYFPYNLNRIILTAKKKTYENDTLSILYIITKRNKLFEDIEKQFTVPVTSKQMKEEILIFYLIN